MEESYTLLRNLKSKVIIHLPVQILPIKVEDFQFNKVFSSSRKLSWDSHVFCNSIQANAFEINLRKEKWLKISIYRPPSQYNVFADKYDNYLIMGDFNLELGNTILTNFLDSNNLANLRILTRKNHRQMKLQWLEKVRMFAFGLLAHQIKLFIRGS